MYNNFFLVIEFGSERIGYYKLSLFCCVIVMEIKVNGRKFSFIEIVFKRGWNFIVVIFVSIFKF